MSMRQYVYALAFMLLSFPALSSETTILLDEDFEDCQLGSLLTDTWLWHNSGNDVMRCVQTPEAEIGGKKYQPGPTVLHSWLDDTLSDKRRSEVVTKSVAHLKNEVEYWLSFQIAVSKWTEPYPPWSTLVQLHSVPMKDGKVDWSAGGGRNAFTLGITPDNQFELSMIEVPWNSEWVGNRGAHGESVWISDYEPGRWYTFDLNIKMSREGTGFSRVWMDGELIYDTGPNVSNIDLIDGHMTPAWPAKYLKFGVYRKQGPSRQDVYYDNIRLEEVVDLADP